MTALETLLKDEPYIQLTIDDGVIYSLSNMRRSNAVMQRPPIVITAKDGYSEREDKTVEYRFKLNSVTDPVWRALFHDSFGYELDVVDFRGSDLLVTVNQEDIKRVFDSAKEAIISANESYSSGREDVFEYARNQVEERAKKSLEEQKLEAQRQAKLKKSFDDLEL
ncbi:MAG: hypothetical protein CMO55_04280 [Verrucomicrobiales bacterium]|nr:hypothetical protein [Verrucomicrobiales bacterium]